MNKMSFLIIILMASFFNFTSAQTSPGKINRLAKKCLAGDTVSCEKLIKIAKSDKSSTSRYNAVIKLNDQKVLTEIVINEKYADIKKIALRKISDENLLIEIINNSQDDNILIAAVDKIEDTDLLTNFALNSNNDNIRIAAIDKIEDTNLLTNFALNSNNYKIRIAAVNQLTDNSVLARIAKIDTDNNVRLAAVKKITDQILLQGIAEKHKEYSIRMAAISALAKDGMVSGEFEFDNNQEYVFSDIKDIQDQTVLLEIAKNGKNIESRLLALNSLDAEIYYEEIIEIINSNKDSFHNLAVIGVLKIILQNEILSNYYKPKNLWVIIENLVPINNINEWMNIRFKIVCAKTTPQSFSIIEIGKYNELININEICEFLLSPLTKDELLKISIKSDIVYLCETAKLML